MHRRDFLAAATAAMTTPLAAQPPQHANPRLDQQRLSGRNGNRSTVVARHGMVCASQPLAANAGVDILQAGGNCIDAAIAANAMLGLTEPASCGIGGDLFAIVWIEKERKLFGLNASGRSPYGWDLDSANRLGLEAIPRESPLSWSVPGCVSGWEALSQRFGKRSLAQCLQPAIAAGIEGFPLSPIISGHFQFKGQDHPTLASVYHPDGRVPGYGDIFANPLLAKSYQAIAADGADAFYRGDIAERIVALSDKLGGKMQMRDLADHSANWVQPVSASYRGWDVWELPPNGQGIAALQILNLLETFDIGELQPNSPEQLHLFIEAKKLAFEDRAKYYADPDFAEVPIAELISKSYAQDRAQLIRRDRASQIVGPGDPKLDSDTVYLTAADGEGNMISLIQSTYYGFGSMLCPEGVGFPIQNRGQAFSLDANHANRLQPHKRPFHTIIPAFLTRDGDPVMSFGVMGGDFQPQGHAQVIMNMIDFGMSPQQAGDQPRIAHSGSTDPWGKPIGTGGIVDFERGFLDQTKVALAEMGHQIGNQRTSHGGYQAIWRLDEPLRYFGGSDPRKDGAAIGY